MKFQGGYPSSLTTSNTQAVSTCLVTELNRPSSVTLSEVKKNCLSNVGLWLILRKLPEQFAVIGSNIYSIDVKKIIPLNLTIFLELLKVSNPINCCVFLWSSQLFWGTLRSVPYMWIVLDTVFDLGNAVVAPTRTSERSVFRTVDERHWYQWGEMIKWEIQGIFWLIHRKSNSPTRNREEIRNITCPRIQILQL